MGALFRGIFGGAAAITMALSTPAWAGDDSSATVSNASISATTPANMTKPQYIGAGKWTINDARLAAANASHNKVAIVVWGGNRDLQFEAYKAAQDLVNEGIPVAFVSAPKSVENVTDSVATFQIYAKSAPQGTSGRFGIDNVSEVRENMYQSAKDAHQMNFPQRVAQLNIK